MSDRETFHLSEGDQRALDALVEAGFDPGRVPEADRQRAEKLAGVLGLLEHLPEERPDDWLTERTLQRIEHARQQDRLGPRLDQPNAWAAAAGGGFHLRDLIATAAVLAIGVALLWPVLANARSTARQIACQRNLAVAGLALQQYAAAHNGQLPATKMRLGDEWWLTGRFDEQGNAKSNSAHLFQLVQHGYIDLAQLTCPENPDAATEYKKGMRDWPDASTTSFSYQNQYTDERPRMDRGPVIAILSDKNPFFGPNTYHMDFERDTNSLNHTRRGQNVLHTDGHVAWLTEPRERHDNIFHAGEHGFDYYTGVEGPAGVSDAMLVP